MRTALGVWIAAGKPVEQAMAEALGGLVLLGWIGLLLVASVASLGAVCAVLAGLLPARVRAAAYRSQNEPARSTLLGAINIVIGLVLAAALGRAGSAFGLVALGVLLALGYFALVGLAGLAAGVGHALFPRGAEPGLPAFAAGGALIALGCFFPVLGQIFGLLCLFCAVGSAIAGLRARP